jgi:hypothetical protein
MQDALFASQIYTRSFFTIAPNLVRNPNSKTVADMHIEVSH